jgi:hypothetical protein
MPVVTGIAGVVLTLGFSVAPAQAGESSAAVNCGSTGGWSSDGGAQAAFTLDCFVGSGGPSTAGIRIDGILHDYAKDGLGPRLYGQGLTSSGSWGPTQEMARNSNGYDGAPVYFSSSIGAYGFNARFKVCNGGVNTNCSDWFGG